MEQAAEDQAVGRLNTLTEIVGLQFGHICAFYQVGPGFDTTNEEQGADDAAEIG